MPFSGALPLAPPSFLKKRGAKNFQALASANLTIKLKTVGTDEVSDGFLPRSSYTSVESETTYSVLFLPCKKFFWFFSFKKRTRKPLSRKEQKTLSILLSSKLVSCEQERCGEAYCKENCSYYKLQRRILCPVCPFSIGLPHIEVKEH